MKEDLRNLVRGAASPLEARNRLREALQARILASLQRSGPPLREDTWRKEVQEKVQALDWAGIWADVRPFLESSDELDLLRPETVARWLLL